MDFLETIAINDVTTKQTFVDFQSGFLFEYVIMELGLIETNTNNIILKISHILMGYNLDGCRSTPVRSLCYQRIIVFLYLQHHLDSHQLYSWIKTGQPQ